MNILISGSGGYIGSVVTYQMLRNGHKVVAIDNFSTGYKQPLEFLQEKFPGQIKMKEIDLRYSTNIFDIDDQIDIVFHLAAHCIVDESVRNPDKFIVENPLMLRNLLINMKDCKVSKIILASTAAVYGEPQSLPVTELAPLKPVNPYGESKVLSENLLKDMSSSNSYSYVILRFFNATGSSFDGLIGDSKKPSELLIQNLVRSALGIEPFTLTSSVVDTPDGSPIRDFVDVEDLATAFELSLDYLDTNHPSAIFNLGSESGFSVKEILALVEKELAVSIPVYTSKARLGEQARMVADSTQVKRQLEWFNKRSITDSIQSLQKWYRSHPHGWNE